ncbi:IS30 family transposase, partial [Bacilli bacterium PM5-3]|nr:IS30 family transposase [Bacilli bacterium PM5-3]
MCLLNNNISRKKYKHLTFNERTMIERWYNIDKRSITNIAELLNKSDRTIRREIKRGKTQNLTTNLEVIEVYSATIAEEKYQENLRAKGQNLKIGNDIELVKIIEQKLKQEKKSPEVIVYELGIKISARTIRNYIQSKEIFNLSTEDMIYNKQKKNKNVEKRISKKVPAEKSIDFRPKEANERMDYGHWEGDLIIGKREKGAVLFTLTERLSRKEIIIKLKNKEAKSVKKALNKLERNYGKRFYSIIKSITFDNGSEFQKYEELEKSCLRKGKRLEVYYAHPYCSGERGSNENNNRMIRRWIPKGTNIDEISEKEIKRIEDWLNEYPRAMFGYRTSNEVSK